MSQLTDSNVLYLVEHALMHRKMSEIARLENSNRAAVLAAPFSLTDSNILYIADHRIFTRKVRELAQQEIQSPLFLERLSQETKIKETVGTALYTQTPMLVDQYLFRVLPKQLQEHLPLAILQQLPAVLAQDRQMASILSTHATQLLVDLTQTGQQRASQLKADIEATGTLALAGLVSDPEYHLLTTAHLAAMREQHAKESATMFTQHQQLISDLVSSGSECIRDCRESMTQVAALKDRVKHLETLLTGLLPANLY